MNSPKWGYTIFVIIVIKHLLFIELGFFRYRSYEGKRVAVQEDIRLV